MANSVSPLTEADFERVQSGLKSAEDAIALAKLSKQAGLDIGDALERAEKSRDQLLRIKQTFFPNR